MEERIHNRPWILVSILLFSLVLSACDRKGNLALANLGSDIAQATVTLVRMPEDASGGMVLGVEFMAGELQLITSLARANRGILAIGTVTFKFLSDSLTINFLVGRGAGNLQFAFE